MAAPYVSQLESSGEILGAPTSGGGSKTTKKEAVDRILDGYDSRHYEAMYRIQKFAFGATPPKEGEIIGQSLYPNADSIVDFPDINFNKIKIGESRRIVKGQFVGLSRMMASTPLPHFPDVDKYTGIARQQFWLKRYQAAGNAGGWDHEFQAAFMDGDGLGLGVLRWGVETNPQTQLQRVCCKHIPTIRVILDHHERNPYRARWVAFVTYMDPADARKKYDSKRVEDATVEMLAPDGESMSRPLKVVRVIHYYDIGYTPGRTPTYVCFVGSVSEEGCVKITESPSGPVLPISMYVHYFAPGMRHPTGRIVLQMAAQKALNDLEVRLMADVNNGGGLRVLDPKQLDPGDMKLVQQGLTNTVRTSGIAPDPHRHAVQHVPPIDPSPVLLQALGSMGQELIEQSGVDDMDRGGQGQKGSTATQNVIQERKSAGDQNWSKFQTAKLIMRSVDTFSMIAKQWDRDPVEIDMLGQTMTINDIADVRCHADQLFAQPSSVYIDEAKITIQSAREERRERLLELAQIAPEMMMINPIKFIQEKIRAALAEDPNDWIPAQLTGAASSGSGALAFGQAASGGMPGQSQGMPSPDGAQGEK